MVVVGAGAAGLTTAEALRRAGHRGPLALVGGEGVAPYDRPPLSKQFLRGEWTADQLALRTGGQTAALDLDLRLATPAVSLDVGAGTVVLADGGQLAYDQLVIATGVRPRRLDEGSPARPLRGVHVLRTVADALGLRAALRPGRRLVVAGGGFVGTEAADVARALGAQVTLVCSGPAPLAPVLGERVGQALARRHRERGVQVRTGDAVAGIALDEHGALAGVRTVGGALLPADDVLVAVGSVPATDWLTGSGVPVRDGVLCDPCCAAADGVWAVGDVARWTHPRYGPLRVEHRTNAAEQALAVAANLLDPARRRPFAPVPYVWSDQLGVRLQAYGVLRGHDEAAVVAGDLDGGGAVVAYRRGDRLVGVLGIGVPPRELRGWRARVAADPSWAGATVPAEEVVAGPG